MGCYAGSGFIVESNLCHAAHIYADAVDDSPAYFLLPLDSFPGIQAEKHEFFIAFPCKTGCYQAAGCKAAVYFLFFPLVSAVFGKTGQFRNKPDQNSCILRDSVHRAKLGHGSRKNSVQRSETVKQTMCQWIGILSGKSIEKQQFQCADFAESFRTVLQKLFFQPLPVAGMKVFGNSHSAEVIQAELQVGDQSFQPGLLFTLCIYD